MKDTNDANTVQPAPPYLCPACGELIRQVLHYNDYLIPSWKPLDDFGENLHYLNCSSCGTCTRVAKLGDAILPFSWPDNVDAEGEARTIAQKVAQIIEEIGPQNGPDPAASIVYRVLAGALSPAAAIEKIRELVQSGILGAIDDPEPSHSFRQGAA